MEKKFNSKTAKNLAEKYKLSLNQITCSNKSNKVTGKDVLNAARKLNKIKTRKRKQSSKEPLKKVSSPKKVSSSKKVSDKSSKKSFSPKKSIKGYNVTLFVEPELVMETYAKNINNMQQFVKWIKEKLPNIRENYISMQNEKVDIINKSFDKLKITFFVKKKSMIDNHEVELIIDSIINSGLDSNGNHPVYVDYYNEIHLNEKSTPITVWGYGEASLVESLVSLKLLKKEIKEIK